VSATPAAPPPLARERTLILGVLLVLAAGCWAVLIWQAASMDRMAMGLTMGLGAPLFLGLWVAMMVAMMFPAAAPMLLLFVRVSAAKQARGQAYVPAWVFIGAYLVVWALAGVVAYGAAVGADHLANRWLWVMEHAARIGGVVFIVAGVYQLSPLKNRCLSNCRTPLSFVLQRWREGYGGAVRMGLEHGLFCLGCCWLLFVMLFPLGMMNVAAMAVITGLVYAEKVFPMGERIAQVAAVALVGYGLLVVLVPRTLPTTL
jgi:predicted metal-binding membrane protein